MTHHPTGANFAPPRSSVGVMDPETGQPIRPGHPLWAVVQAAAAARAANQGPVLLSRTNQSEAGDLSDELGRIAQEGVEEAVRCVWTGAAGVDASKSVDFLP